jgi:hypothetical protein
MIVEVEIQSACSIELWLLDYSSHYLFEQWADSLMPIELAIADHLKTKLTPRRGSE